jgi:hypothetical protein
LIAPVPDDGVYEVRLETSEVRVPGRLLSFAVWSDGIREIERDVRVNRFVLLEVAFEESYRLNFVDADGPSLAVDQVSSALFVDDLGIEHRAVPTQEPWLQGTRVRDEKAGFSKERISYRLLAAEVGGADAAPDAQEVLEGNPVRGWRVPLELHSLSVSVKDAFFGGASGAAIEVQFPDGHLERRALKDGRARLEGLAAGTYRIRAEGDGFSRFKSISIERPSIASLSLLSWFDILLVLSVLAIVGAGLWQLARVPELRPRLQQLRLSRVGRHSLVPGGPDEDPLKAREQELGELKENLSAARAERGVIEGQLKRVLTDLLRLQDERTLESNALERRDAEHADLVEQAERRRRDAEQARAEAQRLKDQLEGTRWSRLLQTEGFGGTDLALQLEGYRRNVNQLESELERTRRELSEERAAKQVMRAELEKRRLQLENLSREKELVSKKLAQAEMQLELIEGIRSERDDLLAQLESQDQAGQKMAASFESLLERLANESRRGGRRAGRESDSGPPRGAP